MLSTHVKETKHHDHMSRWQKRFTSDLFDPRPLFLIAHTHTAGLCSRPTQFAGSLCLLLPCFHLETHMRIRLINGSSEPFEQHGGSFLVVNIQNQRPQLLAKAGQSGWVPPQAIQLVVAGNTGLLLGISNSLRLCIDACCAAGCTWPTALPPHSSCTAMSSSLSTALGGSAFLASRASGPVLVASESAFRRFCNRIWSS